MLQSIGVANGSLAKQFLKLAAVVERPLHLGHEVTGDIYGQSLSLQPDREDGSRAFRPSNRLRSALERRDSVAG